MKSNISTKIMSESETRKKYLSVAKKYGCEKELLQIWDRYEKLLQRCSNIKERQDISIMGNAEIHRLFGFRDGLAVYQAKNGRIVPESERIVLPPDNNFEYKEIN